MSFIVGTSLLAVVSALACALPGVFVVLRRNSMLVEGIAHAVLPGIVVGYALTHDLNSPWLIVGAALGGLLVVLCNEWLIRTGLLTGDAPQGLVFPALFAAGVILISMDFQHVHLHTEVVLVGDLNLAAFHQLTINGVSIGPRYLYVMLAVLAVNVAFISIFYPKLKLGTFDAQFALVLGLRTKLLNTFFMFLVSVTVVTAFHAAGAILVISLLVVPAATAQLISRRLSTMILLTALFAVAGAIAGFWIAYVLNAATSASMALFYGFMFTAVVLINALAVRIRRYRRATASSVDAYRRDGAMSRLPAKPADALAVPMTREGTEAHDRPGPAQSPHAAE
ncbi:MAG: metal ABC transporter permease [Pseudomonadota bacterium]